MKTIKMYLKYQITISNLLILLFIFLFLSLCYFMNIYDINESLDYNQILDFYFQNSLYYTKIIIVFLSCFLFMKLKNERNEYLINVVITAGYTKKDNYKSMIISNMIILLIIISIFFVCYLTIGLLNKHYFVIELKYIISYFNIILLSFHYGIITYLFIQLTNNQMMFIVVILIYLLSDLVIDVNSSIKYLYLSLFPNVNTISGDFYISGFYIVIFIFIIYKINELIYLNLDLRN